MKASLSAFKRKSLQSFDTFRAVALPVVATGATRLALSGETFSAIALSSSLALMYPDALWSGLTTLHRAIPKKVTRNYGLNPHLMLGLLLGAALGGSLLLGIADPAHAQFFSEAEKFMTAKVGVEESLAGLVFNVLRGIFLLYIGISIVQVIQKMQQQEDWQTLARTPLIVVIAVTIGDKLVNLVIGTGGAPIT